MNAKPIIALLVILCVALGGVLLYGLRKTNTTIHDLQIKLADRSNSWVRATAELVDTQRTNKVLQESLMRRTEQVQTFSNRVASLSTSLTNLTTRLTQTEAEAQAAAQQAELEIKKRDERIAELEGQRTKLTRQMNDLTNSITDLEDKIAETERKLAASEGDREFLFQELKRLQADKADLEKQLNNLAYMRDQVRKLRDEMSIAKRLEWFRRGLYGTTEKSAEKLQKSSLKPSGTSTNYNLDVELRQDGEIKVFPAITNLPPATNAPALN